MIGGLIVVVVRMALVLAVAWLCVRLDDRIEEKRYRKK